MVISRKISEKHKEPTKVLRGTVKQNTKLKSNVKSEKLSKKKTEQVINLKAPKVTKGSKIKKVKENSKLIEKASITENRSKAKKVSEKQHDAKSFNAEQTSKSEKHVDRKQKEDSQAEKADKKESKRVSRRILKRKRSAKESTENVQSNLQNASKKKPKKILKRKKKDPEEIEENQETTDNLDLKDLSKEHILQCITAIFHLTQEQLKSKNALFDGESHPVFMQVTCIRVPKAPRRQMRILLPHSIVSPNDDIALFVCDLQRGRRKDYEPTVEHYQELLNKHGCTCIKNVIPMNQVKTEYDQYELKRKLVSSYDHFLVDGRIAGHMSHLLGKEFLKKRKLPTSIKMQSKDLKHEIEYALRKTSMELNSFGDTHIVQIGHTSMKEEEIYENILAACTYLSKNYPGGWANIRSIRIKTATSLSLPIYVTLKNKNSVRVPLVQPRRPKAYRTVQGEVTTLANDVTVAVTPEGDITVMQPKRIKKKEEMQESDV